MLLQELEREGLEGLRRGGDLGEYVDAVGVLLDHALKAPDLALDAAQALEVFALLLVVAVDAAVVVGHHGRGALGGHRRAGLGGRHRVLLLSVGDRYPWWVYGSQLCWV
ncbi:hypothetical protein SAV14893_034740 [Streptomyces avermitilis]|uniref:Uncharacterized protein n=1 Tax=Streptomyces avermitilis TaxID=33903 RepID=A0A4D4LR78_STRAX|nr:hypothetical protein SAV14893_034740 [Streptomyces avermitilis]